MKKFWNLFVLAATVCAVTCTTASCGKGQSDKLDVKGVQELVQKNSDDLTSADVDFFLDQVEILVDNTKNLSKEESQAYFEALDKEEQECALALGIMVSLASSSRAEKTDVWTDAQIKRLNSLKAQMK